MGSLTPGVRWLLAVWTALYLLAAALATLHLADVRGWLELTGPAFWHGQVWRLLTYALLPASFFDLLGNAIALVLLGSSLEAIWTRRDLLVYCLIVALGAAMVKVALHTSNPVPLLGAGPLMFGLMVACGRVLAQQSIMLAPGFSLTIRQAAILWAAFTLVSMFSRAGLANAIITLSGGAFGWAYLWLREKISQSRVGQSAVSQRISRLEL